MLSAESIWLQACREQRWHSKSSGYCKQRCSRGSRVADWTKWALERIEIIRF
ncbi:hypothetical protein PLANPX_5311 [Lacipirellula parvula]|uniref:Uncharacterized protein n=1 Tax=Lacipirellula parvula TaxID=2650471 RepID=A0A5K7XQ73_9BACT|nr:hypothetical protein PLANPX_5311 [Lacipirellula parvula]